MSFHTEKHTSSKTIPWNYFETLTVRDGRGRAVERMTVTKIEEHKYKNSIWFDVEQLAPVD